MHLTQLLYRLFCVFLKMSAPPPPFASKCMKCHPLPRRLLGIFLKFQPLPRVPKGPKDGQREPKGTPKGDKGSQREPKRQSKGSQSPAGGPNYINKLPINRPSGRYVIAFNQFGSRVPVSPLLYIRFNFASRTKPWLLP